MPYHHFTKHLIFVLVILQYELDFNDLYRSKWLKHCINDYFLCNECFPNKTNASSIIETCMFEFEKFKFEDEDIIHTLNSIFGDRELQFAERNDGKSVVIKRLIDSNRLKSFWNDIYNDMQMPSNCNLFQEINRNQLINTLQSHFLDKDRVGGSQLCDFNFTSNFLYNTNSKIITNEVYFWLLLNLNIQPLILTVLRNHKSLPFPQQIKVIGFTSVTENKGSSLEKHFNADFLTRLKISQLLLKGLLTLTNSEKTLQIYLTDLTLDNVVVKDDLTEISFIDLDNIILSNTNFSVVNQKHIHEKIECHGCFAYSVQDICQHSISDINIFAGCQLLNEDLYEDTKKGFLHSIPSDILHQFSELPYELDYCVNCQYIAGIDDCDRFKSAYRLIKLFNNILKVYQ